MREIRPSIVSSRNTRSWLAGCFALVLLAVTCGQSSPTHQPVTGTGTGGNGSGNPGGPGAAGSTGSGGTGTPGSGGDGNPQGGAGGMGGVAGMGGIGNTAGFGVDGDHTGGMGGGGVTVTCQDPIAVTGDTAAAVTVNLGTSRATVGADLTGVHTSVYDVSMQNPSTPSWLKAAGVTSLRYPGGSYADLYHWATHTAETPASGEEPTIVAGADFGSFIGLLERASAHALITANYGSGTAQEAAAWVAYANGSSSSNLALGTDSLGRDWKTVGYWAGLRAASKLTTDDGLNFLRIAHPAPVNIKYWEIGNETYGNGFYYGYPGWEFDMRYDPSGPRVGNAGLHPMVYGMAVRTFATAMKAVDPTIKIGGVLHWPYTEFLVPNWNTVVLGLACGSMDFAVNHWYAGTSPTDLLTRPARDIPMMFSQLHATLGASTACANGASMPIAVTEWGPQYLASVSSTVLDMDTQSQGVFAASAYAIFMEQGALSVHWLELHADGFLGSMELDTASFGYHGALMASLLATAGDTMVQAMITSQGGLGNLLEAHASRHADGGVAAMLVNNSPTMSARVTVTIVGLPSGASLPCVGTRYGYEPAPSNLDGSPSKAPTFSKDNSVVVSVPAHSVVDVVFPSQ